MWAAAIGLLVVGSVTVLSFLLLTKSPFKSVQPPNEENAPTELSVSPPAAAHEGAAVPARYHLVPVRAVVSRYELEVEIGRPQQVPECESIRHDFARQFRAGRVSTDNPLELETTFCVASSNNWFSEERIVNGFWGDATSHYAATSVTGQAVSREYLNVAGKPMLVKAFAARQCKEDGACNAGAVLEVSVKDTSYLLSIGPVSGRKMYFLSPVELAEASLLEAPDVPAELSETASAQFGVPPAEPQAPAEKAVEPTPAPPVPPGEQYLMLE